jgi:hypothetical protein
MKTKQKQNRTHRGEETASGGLQKREHIESDSVSQVIRTRAAKAVSEPCIEEDDS